ncbi:Cytochrome P450 superfamily [Arabidopsis suecica]|uniref:Cytochrome P450 superfamily n=1 Tax=Arabidopsis suecica TaxID=45249 RepID=A0A8T2A1G9_ARASU|nr:Cytochrome P450 superfamily [Arabidopsis suecica]
MSIFLGFLFLFPLFLILFKKLLPSKRKLPPGPRGLPIIGNLHHLGRSLHSVFHKLSLEHGPVMLLHFGVVPVVVFSSKETAKEVLKTHDLDLAPDLSWWRMGCFLATSKTLVSLSTVKTGER